jgi:hypothetical protein
MAQMQLDPSHIMQVGMGFWPSKTWLPAVELELFTELGGYCRRAGRSLGVRDLEGDRVAGRRVVERGLRGGESSSWLSPSRSQA